MKAAHFSFLVSLLYATCISAGELVDTFQKELKVNGETVEVFISSFHFQPDSLSVDFSAPWKVEGRNPLGGFPAKPTKRIGLFYVKWNSNRFDIPLEYYLDCFDPNLSPRQGWWHNQGGVIVQKSDSGNSISVEMEASQIACCGYKVNWVINKQGQVTRFVDSSIP